MSKSGFVFGRSSIDLDDIFQKSVSATPASITSELGYRTANDIDIVNRYRAFAKNTYGTTTNFLTKDGTDLSAIFEWGGFTPTVAFPSVVTTNTATFTISGNYFKITFLVKNFEPNLSGVTDDIHSSIDKSINPYTIQITGLVPKKTYPFTIIAYNPFFTKTQTINSSFITNGEPIFTRISLIAGDKVNQFFTFDGANLAEVRYIIDSGPTQVYLMSEPLPLKINRTSNYTVQFFPVNSLSDQGNSSTKSISFDTTEINSTGYSPPFSYQATVNLVGGGGSGGSGGTKRFEAGWGGGGAGGGSGGIQNAIYKNIPSSQTTYLFTIVVGGGGVGAFGRNGVPKGESRDGFVGNSGGSSSISVTNGSNIPDMTVTGGTGGQEGNGDGTGGTGGANGTPDGVIGRNGLGGSEFNGVTAAGGQGGQLDLIINNITYGRGSDGSAGQDNSKPTDSTTPGFDGYCRIIFKHIVMTTV